MASLGKALISWWNLLYEDRGGLLSSVVAQCDYGEQATAANVAIEKSNRVIFFIRSPCEMVYLLQSSMHPSDSRWFIQGREYTTTADANLLDQSIDRYFGIAWLVIDTKVLWTGNPEGCMLRTWHSQNEKRVASYS